MHFIYLFFKIPGLRKLVSNLLSAIHRVASVL